MHFDALTLACVVAELSTQLCPGRIQQVLLVNAHTLGCEVYTPGARHQLLLALTPGQARIQTVTYKLRRGVDTESPLLLLLRKYARGARLAAIVQPDPVERVAHFQLEHPEFGATTLVVELIGRQPNAFLLHPSGRILDCLHRQPAAGDGRRLLPGQPYTAPAAMDKLSPIDSGAADYYAQLAQLVAQPGPLWKTLVAGIAGLSPTAAREVAWRAAGAAEAAGGANLLAVAQALQELWAPVHSGAWQPGLVEADGATVGATVGFAPYPLHFRGRFVAQASMCAALERYFVENTGAQAADPYAAQRGQVSAQVKRAVMQVERRLAALAGDEPAPGAAEALRTEANWLLALSSQVQPGQRVLVVETGSEALNIALDTQFTPVEQAQRMFKRAAKLERAAVAIPLRRAELHADLALLAQLALDAQHAANQPELAAVRDELRRAGFERTPEQRASAAPKTEGGPLRYRTRRGAEIIVGRNARQNEQVTFKLARPDDTWLHVRGAPGAHVIVRGPSSAPDAQDVRAAAQLAAYHSSVRGERKVDVIVTARRWVSRAPGGRTGQVTVAREQVLIVPAEAPDGLELLAREA